jgi:DNA-binding CsgD family transcriptional regulator
MLGSERARGHPTCLGFADAQEGFYAGSMATQYARTRCIERLELLGESDLPLDDLRREAVAELRRAVGFERWCVTSVDPDTHLPNRGFGEHAPGFAAEFPWLLVHDSAMGDVNNRIVLARSRNRVGILSAATAGEPERCRRYVQTYDRYGIGDEMRTMVADEAGTWGIVELFRDDDQPNFDEADAQLMRQASLALARVWRRGAIGPADSTECAPAETGVLLLGDDLRPRSSTGAARQWFAALNPPQVPFPHAAPTPVWSAVGRLLAAERGEDPEIPARVRVRAGDGSWGVVEAARLDGADGGIAVSLHPASSGDVLGLLGRAYGLSARERELVGLLVEGLDTKEIAERLFISRYTVQDHCKSVFEKVGVNSRRELVSGVFSQAA